MNPSGSPTSKLPDWYRAIAILVGVVSIALAFVVLAFPGLAVLTLVFLLALALLVIGVDRLMAGITGHPWGPAFPLAPFAPPKDGGASAPESPAETSPPK
jgi:hypothetical protein